MKSPELTRMLSLIDVDVQLLTEYVRVQLGSHDLHRLEEAACKWGQRGAHSGDRVLLDSGVLESLNLNADYVRKYMMSLAGIVYPESDPMMLNYPTRPLSGSSHCEHLLELYLPAAMANLRRFWQFNITVAHSAVITRFYNTSKYTRDVAELSDIGIGDGSISTLGFLLGIFDRSKRYPRELGVLKLLKFFTTTVREGHLVRVINSDDDDYNVRIRVLPGLDRFTINTEESDTQIKEFMQWRIQPDIDLQPELVFLK